MSTELLVNCMVMLSLLFWGAWGIFDKKGLGHTKPLGQLVAVYSFSPIFALILAAVLSLCLPGWHLTAHIMFWQSIACLCYFIATTAYLQAMNRGDASVILGVTSCYPLISQFLAFFMLHEALVPARLVGACIIVAGVVALSGPSRSHSSFKRMESKKAGSEDSIELIEEYEFVEVGAINRSAHKSVSAHEQSTRRLEKHGSERSDANFNQALSRGQVHESAGKMASSWKDASVTTFCVLLAVFGWAIRGMFDKISLESAHPFEVYLGKFIWDSVLGALALIWVYFKCPEIKLWNPPLFPWAAGSAICLAGGSAAYYVALSMQSASYVIAITGCYPLLMYLLALLVLKEKFYSKRAIGIGLITFGGILTQLTQGS